MVIALSLFFFSGKLFEIKRRALAEYNVLQQQISRDFHYHWIDDRGAGADGLDATVGYGGLQCRV